MKHDYKTFKGKFYHLYIYLVIDLNGVVKKPIDDKKEVNLPPTGGVLVQNNPN